MERKLVIISWCMTMCYFVVFSDGNKYEYPPPFYTHLVVVDHVILEGEKLYKEVHKRDTILLLSCGCCWQLQAERMTGDLLRN